MTITRRDAFKLVQGLMEQIVANSPNVGRYEFSGIMRRDNRDDKSVDISVSVHPEKS
jgi:hypothetical protein